MQNKRTWVIGITILSTILFLIGLLSRAGRISSGLKDSLRLIPLSQTSRVALDWNSLLFHPEVPEAWDCERIKGNDRLRGDCFFHSGDFFKAAEAYNRCLHSPSLDDLCRLKLGDAYFMLGDSENAKSTWSELAASNLFFLRVGLALEWGDLTKAADFLDVALLTLEQSRSFMRQDQFFDYTIIQTSNRLRDLGIKKEEEGDLEIAEIAYRAALTAYGKNALAAFRLALIARRAGDLQYALELLSIAQTTPYASLLKSVFLEFGDIYHQLGNLQAAVSSYTSALETGPDLEVARLRRALVYVDLQDFASAKQDLELLQNSNDPSIRSAARQQMAQINH